MEKIETAMKRLQDHNLKAKVLKYKFLQKKVSYLGYEITNAGLFSQNNKIDAAFQMASPAARKLFQGFLRMFDHYHGLYPASKINMQPLTSLTSPKIKSKRNKEASISFDDVK